MAVCCCIQSFLWLEFFREGVSSSSFELSFLYIFFLREWHSVGIFNTFFLYWLASLLYKKVQISQIHHREKNYIKNFYHKTKQHQNVHPPAVTFQPDCTRSSTKSQPAIPLSLLLGRAPQHAGPFTLPPSLESEVSRLKSLGLPPAELK